MFRFLSLFFILFPVVSQAAQYTGHITKISVGEKGKNLVFEVANSDGEICESSWFKVVKPAGQELSPADFIAKSYFSNKKITIHASEVCAPLSSPSSVNRVTLGTSTDEVKALIHQIREKRKSAKK